MSREQKSVLSKLFAFLIFVVCVVFLIFLRYNKQNNENECNVDSTYTSDISWSYYFDKTPKFDSITHIRTIIVPIEKGENSGLGNKDCLIDSTKYARLIGDSAVSLPVEQRVYSDSTYTAYVSGYEPRLDSIRIKYPTITNTITKTITIKNRRKWNISVVGGYGYGILSNRIEPFLGIGFSYNLLGK